MKPFDHLWKGRVGIPIGIAWFVACYGGMTGCQTLPQPLHLEVNPFIGTGGHGHTYPGATSPFGMVQLSPDTRLDGWDGCGGYHYTDSVVYGFSHTHLQGTGVSDYGDILVMPCTKFGPGDTWRDMYQSRLNKATEKAHAGWYSCDLVDQNIHVELTTTPRMGIHRYSLREQDTLTLMVDLDHRDALVHYSIEPRGSRTVVGHRVSQNWAQEQHVYFALKFDRDFVWEDQMMEIERIDTLAEGSIRQIMRMVPVFKLDFGMVETLNVQAGISFCDIEGALRNLESEAIHGFDFDAYAMDNRQRWDEQLGRVSIEGGSPSDRTVFYTALYHATTVPNLASDVDGRYRGTDLQVHALKPGDGEHYTVFSLWDTYRALHPLLAWIEPERTRDMIRTMLRMYRDGGQLPVWELASNYTGCMIGYHSVPVMADATSWGIEGWDERLALEAMIQAADSLHLGLDAYASLGYIPSDHEHESVSKTLEYAFDDACIARHARRVGDTLVATRFERRATHWKNLVHPETKFIQPKRQGAWIEGFDPREVNFNFTEANGWQYLFAVPHDIEGQRDLMGGDDAYLQRLDDLFQAPIQTTGRVQPDITGLIGQYAHGNEPSHHVAYLPSYAGEPSATASRVRQICREFYTAEPDGLCGNEDCGQMSAWYVWSALGMYPVEPGSGQVVLGSPMFPRVVIAPAGGNATTEIRARGLNDRAIYPTAIRWHESGGRSSSVIKQSYLTTTQLRTGGMLEVLMASTPDPMFGRAESDRPHSSWIAQGSVPVPAFEAPRSFRDSTAWVALQHLDSSAVLQWSDDAGQTWNPAYDPWAVHVSSVLWGRAIVGKDTSSVVSHEITRVDHQWVLTLDAPADNQYTAGGSDALIDGLRGGIDFRTGEWQGHWGHDVVATLDLGSLEEVNSMEISALQDIKPWIWSPKRVLFSASSDGVDFDLVHIAQSHLDEDDWNVQRETFVCDQPVTTRYIQIQAEGRGPIPAWHLGSGNDRWMFLDEIVLDLKN
ncbi:MAG: GH92 family glycosyl hydrolase [Bacteroidetes bacterium]|nr:GH92 family glycosyl hydrolase [Bacteroidota bacterium]MDA0902706.1 GH92 family glycosyl hydrolase [Bacteroidota bacterium]MDA1241787.1 GH92 family glycosyl hydrolase [Bacteroidota bacterium]